MCLVAQRGRLCGDYLHGEGLDRGLYVTETKENIIKNVTWFFSGLLTSAVSVFLIGFLSIQISGISGGAVFGIDNQLVAVTTPNPGFIQMLARAAVASACVALMVLILRRGSQSARVAFLSGFIGATLVQIAISAVLAAREMGATSLNTPLSPWVKGWVEEGGMNSAVHLLLIIAIFLLFAGYSEAKRVLPPEDEKRLANDLSRDGGSQS